jgi:trimethylamine---corrinoid protein Co-methyltransferase
MSADVRPEIQTQITFLETVKNFSKTINFSTNDSESLKDIIEIASVVAGGLKNLQKKPFIFNYCEPIPPLSHPSESTEKLYISAENRIPVVYMPYCMMGGTSPMSFAGTLAQCNADVLTGLVIHQLVSEGAPFIYGSMPSVFDMRTTIGSYGAPEFHLLVAASSDLAAYYGIPFYGTAGCTDAKVIDEQAVTETTMEIFSTLLSKAHIVHDIGVMDHCNSVSPELVVLADEVIEGLKHYAQGVEVNPEELTLDVIREVGPGGHYLTNRHTLRNFKKVWYPNFFSREMQNPSESQIKGKIKEKIQWILDNHEVPQLDPAILSELDKWHAKYE